MSVERLINVRSILKLPRNNLADIHSPVMELPCEDLADYSS